jgi:hypothetical protein
MMYQAAVNAAIDNGDLATAISSLVRVTRDRQVVEAAIARLNLELERDADDPVLRRARSILTGALSTTLYASPRTNVPD